MAITKCSLGGSAPRPDNISRKLARPRMDGSPDITSVRWKGQVDGKEIGALERRKIIATIAGMAVSGSTKIAQAAPAPFCGAVNVIPPWAFSLPWRETVLDFEGLGTWTRVIGKDNSGGIFGFLSKSSSKRKKLPLLCVHGGPGLPSRYLETLELLAGQDRQIIFYDQVGCGNSFKASGKRGPAIADMSADLYTAELAAVRKGLGLEESHLLGHGWGGQLALHALVNGGAEGVASLTLSSTAPSQATLIADRQKRMSELPEDARAAALECQTDMAALLRTEYGRRYLTRRTNAGCLTIAEAAEAASSVQALTGGQYFEEGGALKGWTVQDRLKLVNVPTLVTKGDTDEVLPETAALLAKGLQSAQVVSFQGAGNFQHIDACEAYLEVVNEFLERHDI